MQNRASARGRLWLCLAMLPILAVFGILVFSNPHSPLRRALFSVLGQSQVFDGKQTYNEALDAVISHHLELADPAAQAKFRKEWDASRFDKTGELKTEEGTDQAIEQMLQACGQRFDYFMDKEATKAELEQTNSQLVGIGTTIKLRDTESLLKSLPKGATRAQAEKVMKIGKGHEMVVERPVEGGPASSVLKPGDEFVKIDGKSLDGLTLKEATALIRGQEGTVVEITVKRTAADGTTSEQTFKITRALVVMKVVHTRDLGDGITYVKVDHFMSKNVVTEFAAALKTAAKGKGLVIDLRGNPGGALDAVLTMGAQVLPEGTLLETRARKGNTVGTHITSVRKEFLLHQDPNSWDPSKQDVTMEDRPDLLIPENMPIVVLVDQHSASASEILSGLLQHAKRATIVGKATLGKGVGQTVVDLPFGRRLHITSFEFRPGGAPMDWIGVIPDVEVDQPDPDANGNKTDAQLDAAVKQVKSDVAAKEARAKKSDELSKRNHDEFEETLKARKK